MRVMRPNPVITFLYTKPLRREGGCGALGLGIVCPIAMFLYRTFLPGISIFAGFICVRLKGRSALDQGRNAG
jgi:hypothetical protein